MTKENFKIINRKFGEKDDLLEKRMGKDFEKEVFEALDISRKKQEGKAKGKD